jgi:hypothetical protein
MYACTLRTTLVFGRNKFLVRVFLRLFFTSLAWTGSLELSEIRCCDEAVHTRRHREPDKMTEQSNSEIVASLLLQDIQKYPLVRRVPQEIGTFRMNV